MAQTIRPAIFKSIKEINLDRVLLEKILRIPYFQLRFEYEFWISLSGCYMYWNDEYFYLLELDISRIDTDEIIELSKKFNEDYTDLIIAIQYCGSNNIDWLQLMVI